MRDEDVSGMPELNVTWINRILMNLIVCVEGDCESSVTMPRKPYYDQSVEDGLSDNNSHAMSLEQMSSRRLKTNELWL